MARVAALLSPYFEKDTPLAVRKMEAEDWAIALTGYPQWAVEKAVRWWKSADNDKRRGRPVEGDIAARVRVEMQFVRDAQAGLKIKPMPKRIETTAYADPATAEDRKRSAADILAQAGYTPRRIGAKP